jgi:Flp pilus assembly protein TadD
MTKAVQRTSRARAAFLRSALLFAPLVVIIHAGSRLEGAALPRDGGSAIPGEAVKADSAGETSSAGTALADAAAAILLEADRAFERGDKDMARALYEKAANLDPASVHALGRLALLQARSGEMKAALANYRRAVALAPGDLDLSLDLAAALSSEKDLREAIAIYRSLRTAHPDDGRVLLGLARALIAKRRYAEAETLLRDLVERRIEPVEAHLLRARILVIRRDYAEAEHFYRDVLRANPGNLQARTGLVAAEHLQGLDRAALPQSDNIVFDHPESAEARELQQDIHRSVRPRSEADLWRRSDDGGNRVDGGTAAYTFMAEPQTAVRIAYGTVSAEFRCKDATLCDEALPSPPGPVVDQVVGDDARILTAGVNSRLIRPLRFEARIGAVREEPLGGGARTVAIVGGSLRWQVGPGFAVMTDGGREALVDTARLIDRGLKTDSANAHLEYRFHVDWIVTWSAGYATYSDHNAREAAGVAVQWRLPPVHPRVTTALELDYRRFHDDRDNGYFDPLRYDSELARVGVADEYRNGRISWRFETAYGRQNFDDAEPQLETRPGDTVKSVLGAFGVGLGTRARLEAFYSRSDHALQAATGFTASQSGVLFRFRL